MPPWRRDRARGRRAHRGARPCALRSQDEAGPLRRLRQEDAGARPARHAQAPRTSAREQAGHRMGSRKLCRTRLRTAHAKSDKDVISQQDGAGWGAWIRTRGWRNQNPLPYHLATPQCRPVWVLLGPHRIAAASPPGNEALRNRRVPTGTIRPGCIFAVAAAKLPPGAGFIIRPEMWTFGPRPCPSSHQPRTASAATPLE
jgi:hypothetical protein